jgi:sodium-dependent dicarboxylate transporter 2/3/5
MTAATPNASSGQPTASAATLVLQFASGPIVFLLLSLLPYGGVPPEGRTALGVFGWMVMWWMARPVPWAVASILPLILFPMFNVMNVGATVVLYGQNIFFWIWGTVLMGYAMDRHGLAKRFALWFMSLKWVNGSANRTAFGFMLVTGLISMMLSDAATVAVMIPVAVSLVAFVRTVQPQKDGEGKSNFGAFLALGALYGSVAGGTATIAGIPHNALSVALLEQLTGRALGWFEWMVAGVPVFVVLLLVFYFVLLFFLPPEFKVVPGGTEFLRAERARLGPLSAGEKSTLFVFAMMVTLFVLPTALGLTLGAGNPVTVWARTGLNLYVVPPIVLLLLFGTPVDWRRGQYVLGWREAVTHTPWDIMILVASATGVVNALVEFRFVELAGEAVAGLGFGDVTLAFVASVVVAFSTNVISGVAATSFFGGLFIPAAQEVGWNPAAMAILIPNAAVGIALPWAGASCGTAFATGQIEMKDMIKIGMVATLVFAFAIAAVHLLMAPFV